MVDSFQLSQGGKANKQGKILESTIIPTLEARGLRLVNYSDWQKYPQLYGEELILKHAPYKTIYGHIGKSEFLIKSSRFNLTIRIECKWQQSQGLVDEKYPYLYLNCVEAIEEDVIIIIDGGGMKPEALKWLKEAAKYKKYMPVHTSKSIQVFSLSEFLRWANMTLQ
jgi:hypothetical protein